MSTAPLPVSIQVDGERTSGLWQRPGDARAIYVLAHGAGAGMTHREMEAVANALCDAGIAVLRFNFLYMEHGGKRPDAPKLAHAAIRAAVAEATKLAPDLPLYAGGRSFGGRMTSQAQALEPLPNVRGLIFVGFPLHPAGKPSTDRAAHLSDVHIPMLFLQGSRDALAELHLLRPVVEELGTRATLHVFEGADHSFHVLKSSGTTDAKVRAELCDAITSWISDTAT